MQIVNTLIHGFNLPCRIFLPICRMVFIYQQKATAFWQLSFGHAWKTNCLLFHHCFPTGVTWTTRTPRPVFCDIPAGRSWGSHARQSQPLIQMGAANCVLREHGTGGAPAMLFCPLPLVCGRIKVSPLGVCPGVVFLHAAVARIAVGMSSSFLGLLCGQGIEAAMSSSWLCWALGIALWLILSTCFKHRGAHKRQ